jgi:hypothetical protein
MLIKVTPPGEETKEITFGTFLLWASDKEATGRWLSEEDDITLWRAPSVSGEIKVEGLKGIGRRPHPVTTVKRALSLQGCFFIGGIKPRRALIVAQIESWSVRLACGHGAQRSKP